MKIFKFVFNVREMFSSYKLIYNNYFPSEPPSVIVFSVECSIKTEENPVVRASVCMTEKVDHNHFSCLIMVFLNPPPMLMQANLIKCNGSHVSTHKHIGK